MGNQRAETSGSLKAIAYEVKHGDIFTILDEIWHSFDWFLPSVHWRFCQWAHREEA